jgi:REP element-mobilizing transposase RayT
MNKRYLAPWSRKATTGDLDAVARVGTDGGSPGESEPESPCPALRAIHALTGKPAIYHCISRVVDRRFALGEADKEHFTALLRMYEAFCQVRVLTFCVMSNHFHILVEIPERPATDPTDAELLEHLKTLYRGGQWEEIRWQLEFFRKQGNHEGAEQLRQKFLARMWDLSAFMHSLKRRFSQWYNLRHEREGYLWSERFKSVLVESGHAARVMAAYIDLNPVRAGIVEHAQDYRWNGSGEAWAGKAKAREGLRWLMLEYWRQAMSVEVAAARVTEWRQVAAGYRQILAEAEEWRRARQAGNGPGAKPEKPGDDGAARDSGPAKATKRGRGRPSKVAALMTEAQMLGHRVRYFTDGMVLGSREFVEQAFTLTRSWFGPRRRSGARKLARADTALRAMRNLQVDRYD